MFRHVLLCIVLLVSQTGSGGLCACHDHQTGDIEHPSIVCLHSHDGHSLCDSTEEKLSSSFETPVVPIHDCSCESQRIDLLVKRQTQATDNDNLTLAIHSCGVGCLIDLRQPGNEHGKYVDVSNVRHHPSRASARAATGVYLL